MQHAKSALGALMKAAFLALATTSCTAGIGEAPGSGLTVFASEAADSRGELTFTLDRGRGIEVLEPHQGIVDPQGFDYPLAPGQPAKVRVSYRIADGELAALETPIPAQSDITYSVYAYVGREDPTAQCMGCMDLQSAPLDSANDDGVRLWLYTSFNGISHPILF